MIDSTPSLPSAVVKSLLDELKIHFLAVSCSKRKSTIPSRSIGTCGETIGANGEERELANKMHFRTFGNRRSFAFPQIDSENMASVFSSFRSMVLRARIPSRTIANPLVSRNLRSSAVLRASEAKGGGEGYDGPGQGYDGPSIPLYDRLSSSPPALAAIEHLVKLIKSKSGVDLQGGDAPSMNLMGQLANDPELRSAAQK